MSNKDTNNQQRGRSDSPDELETLGIGELNKRVEAYIDKKEKTRENRKTK